MPARPGKKPEAVACGLGHADAPARRGGAGFERWRRPDEKQRPAAVIGGELKLLAGPQVEPVDRRGDGLRHARMQSLRHGPQRVFAMRGCDQRDAGRIEAEAVETVSGNMPAKTAMLARAIGGQDEDDGFWRQVRQKVRQNGDHEAEGTGDGAFRIRHDLVQGAAREAATRQMGIQSRQAEGQGAVDIVYARHETA